MFLQVVLSLLLTQTASAIDNNYVPILATLRLPFSQRLLNYLVFQYFVSDEGSYRNGLCLLILISTFLLLGMYNMLIYISECKDAYGHCRNHNEHMSAVIGGYTFNNCVCLINGLQISHQCSS